MKGKEFQAWIRLSNDVNAMRSDVQAAKDDAARANQRLDNMATKYRK